MRKLSLLFIAILFFQSSCSQQTSEVAKGPSMVSSAHPLATQAGLDILAKGGNAFDAAVAIAAALNVVEPMMSGMGGYGTILVYDAKEKKVRYLDSSGKIPLNTNADLMRAPTPDYLKNRRGAKAVSTPGNVNAWAAMSSEYGNLEWDSLFETAIDLSENGFKVSPRLGRFIKGAFPEFSDYTKGFYGKEGSPLEPGDLLIQKDLAGSFKLVARQGKSAFYNGSIGRAVDGIMKSTGGFLSAVDLENDKAEWWEPVKVNYKGYDVYTASPPATAFPSLVRLGLMSQMPEMEHNSKEYLHAFAEVTKHAFWSRLKYAGDPEITPPPLDLLLSEDYWTKTVANLSGNKASTFIPPGKEVESKNTTHFVVADQWGNIVSATQTLGNVFGSRIMAEGTGIWLNNSLAYCTYEPKGNPMDAIPGQRKLSGDCPTIIMKDGKPWAALGTPGGHTIGQNVPQIVLNLLEFDMDMQEAIDAPKVTFIEPNTLAVENEIDDKIFNDLKNSGHDVQRISRIGNAHGLRILYDESGNISGYQGGADKRGEGLAKGN
ncbi:MAG: gamma-glutamyltransferase [Roseivirga sp.]|nr:gamma-glutamyltransferase [Roseivirga sp.]